MTPADAIFKSTFKHHYWSHCIEQVVDALLHRPDKSIIALIGPTGVGKSRAIETIIRRITREKKAELEKDPSQVPFGFVEVPKLHARRNVWPATLKLLVESLGEPLAQHKIRDFSNPADQARFDLEAIIERRRPYAIFLDEFHHLVGNEPDATDQDQIEFLKSICNRSSGKFVIIGTVRALRALQPNSETARRTEVVPFPRYRSTEKDLVSYKAVVVEIEKLLGAALEKPLSEDMEYVYDRTIGCVGLLRNWLYASLNLAMRSNGVITKRILEGRRLELKTLKSIFNDAVVCERYVEEKEEDWHRLRKTIKEDGLGLEVPPLDTGGRRRP